VILLWAANLATTYIVYFVFAEIFHFTWLITVRFGDSPEFSTEGALIRFM